jgi:hypothetical protein
MTQSSRAASLALFATLAGCTSIQPTVPTTTPPDASSGYVAGAFTRTNTGGVAFILKGMDSGVEYAMPLGEDSPLPKDVKDQVVAVKVPPGRYAVSHWITYGTLDKSQSTKTSMSNAFLAAPFVVEAGSVIYLGAFSVTSTTTPGYPKMTIHWSVKPMAIHLNGARAAFLKTYPMFGSVPFVCRLCLDTLANPSERLPTATPKN